MQIESSEEICELLDTVTQNGRAMLKDLDFHEELKVLAFGFFEWNKKANILRELKAFYLALWRFALTRSFPDRHEEIYAKFLSEEWFWPAKDKNYIVEYAQYYFEKLREKGFDDFTIIAKHLLSFAEFDDNKTKAYALKLALIFRAKYNLFFEHLL